MLHIKFSGLLSGELKLKSKWFKYNKIIYFGKNKKLLKREIENKRGIQGHLITSDSASPVDIFGIAKELELLFDIEFISIHKDAKKINTPKGAQS